MKLKTYSPQNLPVVITGQPLIRINVKSGLISFSKMAVKELGISSSHGLQFHQDEDRPQDWYVSISAYSEPDCFSIRVKDHSLSFNCRALVQQIQDSIPNTKGMKSFRMNLSTTPMDVDGMTLYSIITKSAAA
ncbi:hypothetical protein [Roseivirga thermotolerans]|uniref:Uncharacterized protein n=1 Tax=Roseivirga thermotolerans TaxID=1758176 RepID=A0ABQ3I531_9BACT|nr:hypothetical protein [Roseivirga thermotolerans]GHE65150.1 hypothetical protein GCM10011340_20270 [Roseivirga thermotolerans]